MLVEQSEVYSKLWSITRLYICWKGSYTCFPRDGWRLMQVWIFPGRNNDTILIVERDEGPFHPKGYCLDDACTNCWLHWWIRVGCRSSVPILLFRDLLSHYSSSIGCERGIDATYITNLWIQKTILSPVVRSFMDCIWSMRHFIALSFFS